MGNGVRAIPLSAGKGLRCTSAPTPKGSRCSHQFDAEILRGQWQVQREWARTQRQGRGCDSHNNAAHTKIWAGHFMRILSQACRIQDSQNRQLGHAGTEHEGFTTNPQTPMPVPSPDPTPHADEEHHHTHGPARRKGARAHPSWEPVVETHREPSALSQPTQVHHPLYPQR